ncbi:transmembrane anchor protein [Neorhizobium petrolearium]|uniref:Transmembrane anchor protein n=1 Tax=Neorhizobium petrolearium TaxID=515361 RepID=A0ABY8M497_9HYPH|nr:transmembrane anchor protein [Neorhizobium petrolearium]MCC2613383.1 transmembrane anchor protein [Neorhizobium petrolearium]WGI68464.1 transmembrane anchor protein [Neorhizobium petrolearium]
MFNSQAPNPDDLPSSRQLVKSTVISVVAAAALLVTVVMPSEYGIDPTGVGSALGLTEMGEIKTQLAEEAELDRQNGVTQPVPVQPTPQQGSSVLDRIIREFGISAAYAQDATRADEMSVTLQPGEATEIKLTMSKGAKATYEWTTEGGGVNYDMHADGNSGQTTSYKKGRAEPTDSGEMEAAFDGKHGWFWRNRTGGAVTITLKTNGAYSDIKRMM